MRFSRRKKICYPVFATFNKPPKASSKSHWKLWLAGGLFILLIGGAIYLFLFSPVFKIKEIKISGSNLIAVERIQTVAGNVLQAKIFKIIPRDTALVLINDKIRQDIFGSFPEIATVDVSRKNTSQLDISVTERKTAAVVCRVAANLSPLPSSFFPTPSAMAAATSSPAQEREKPPESEQCFFTDDSGFIYREAPEISGTLLPTFYSDDASLCQIRARAVSAVTIAFASAVKKELQSSGVDLTQFVLNNEINTELRVFTVEGWFIYFDMSRSALVQARVLETLLKDEIKTNRATLQYVDLRVEDRVYYR